jgi:hypothetical protein
MNLISSFSLISYYFYLLSFFAPLPFSHPFFYSYHPHRYLSYLPLSSFLCFFSITHFLYSYPFFSLLLSPFLLLPLDHSPSLYILPLLFIALIFIPLYIHSPLCLFPLYLLPSISLLPYIIPLYNYYPYSSLSNCPSPFIPNLTLK